MGKLNKLSAQDFSSRSKNLHKKSSFNNDTDPIWFQALITENYHIIESFNASTIRLPFYRIHSSQRWFKKKLKSGWTLNQSSVLDESLEPNQSKLELETVRKVSNSFIRKRYSETRETLTKPSNWVTELLITTVLSIDYV